MRGVNLCQYKGKLNIYILVKYIICQHANEDALHIKYIYSCLCNFFNTNLCNVISY